MATIPTRMDGELFEAAKAAGRVPSRSAAQQLDHWARIGRELEASPAVTHSAIERVLTGQVTYDDVDERTQSVVRAAWDEGIDARLASLDLTGGLARSGRPWPEADDDGEVVQRGGSAPSA